MTQTDLFPYLMDQDLIKTYWDYKKEIKKIDRAIGKIEYTRINTPSLRYLQENGTFSLQDFSLYKLNKELEVIHQELMVHYQSRMTDLIKAVKAFQFIMNHLTLYHYLSKVYHV